MEMHHPAPLVRQHEKHVQDLKTKRGHGEEVDGHQIFDVAVQEGAPGLGGRPARAHEVLNNLQKAKTIRNRGQEPMRQALYRISGVDLTGIDAIGVETVQVGVAAASVQEFTLRRSSNP